MALDNTTDDFKDASLESQDAATEKPLQAPYKSSRSRRERLRAPLLIAAIVVALLAALLFYLRGGRYETTDNAYFQSGLVSISPNVSGSVIAVAVRENEQVKTGQLLFRIDPAPFRAAVDEAAAQLASVQTSVASLRAKYRQGQAELQTARDKLTYAAREAARQKGLVAEGISSQAQYDQAILAEQTARQGIETSKQQNASIAAELAGGVDTPIEKQPSVQRAEAALERARLNLGYTEIRAPQDGIVTKVNQLQVGNYVSASRPVFTLAGTRIWVEANFKESQLNHMRLGQRATFTIDAYPDLRLTGHLVSFSPGTGNSFALLPPENATGNWVKVVQRLPVEFAIDRFPRDVPLHAGLSVEVTVDTGYQRRLFAGRGTPDRAAQ